MWGRARRRRRPSGPGRADESLRRALLCVLDDDLEEAEALLRDVAEEDSSAALHLALARLYRRRGEIGRAVHLHQNLLLRGDLDRDERVAAELGLGDDFRAAGLLKRASAAYDAVLEDHPKDPRALAALLAVLDDRGESERALEIAKRIRGGGRNDLADRYVGVAEQAFREGDEAGARRALKRVGRNQRHHVRALVLSGELEASRGRARRAVSAWRKAATLDPTRASELYERIAALFASLDRPAETARFLRAEIEGSGSIADVARLELARHLEASGQPDDALVELKAIGPGSPQNDAAQILRGRLALDHGDDAARTAALATFVEVASEEAPAPATATKEPL